MAGRGSRAQRAREEAERARLYAARTAWHERQVRRRRRDTVIAAVAGGVIVVGALVSQALHAQITAPEPEPSSTPTVPSPEPSSAPTAPSPAPSTTPTLPNAPTDAPTPVPTQTPD
ncbi:hypothetical protein [Microbacterium sp.]|uniref:hypothetical protein n=1 Tax=Microbacterium sp. TaxID=51671 RepID=UPI0028111450|nr:hypothetical protein [Microbacterium sp.]